MKVLHSQPTFFSRKESSLAFPRHLGSAAAEPLHEPGSWGSDVELEATEREQPVFTLDFSPYCIDFAHADLCPSLKACTVNKLNLEWKNAAQPEKQSKLDDRSAPLFPRSPS